MLATACNSKLMPCLRVIEQEIEVSSAGRRMKLGLLELSIRFERCTSCFEASVMADKIVVSVRTVFRHEHLTRGKFTYMIPLDPEVQTLVGSVVVYWGAFEVRMNSLIFEFTRALGRSLPRDWERQEFRRRKETFKKLASQYAREMFPEWEVRLSRIADTAGDLHWKRNVFAHGHYEVHVNESDPGAYRMRASGVVKGKVRTLVADVETLSKLWHDISHLLGDLMVFVNHTGAKSSALEAVVPDVDLMGPESTGSARLLEVSEMLQSLPPG